MTTRILILALIPALMLSCVPLTRAQTKLEASHNKVTYSKRGVQTGSESRAELSNTRGTIRVGANSSVGIRSSEEKTLDLKKGVMMVSTARKGLKRQSLTVETEQIRATANATMIISYQPRRYIKIACTEGRVTVSLKGIAKESVTIRKGQMLIINCLENVLPAAVSVDMNRLMRTSPLLRPGLRGGPASAATQQGALAVNGRQPQGNGAPPQGQAPNRNGPPSGQPAPAQLQQPPPGPAIIGGARLPFNPRTPQPNNLPGRRKPTPP